MLSPRGVNFAGDIAARARFPRAGRRMRGKDPFLFRRAV
jgi:hypothetical protein